jgi:hypothetical protein
MLIQYFINYNFKKGWYVTTSPIITANWEGNNCSVWTVPFGGGAGRIMKIGNQPVNIQTQFFWQCQVSFGRFSVGHAPTNRTSVSQNK